MAKKGSKTVDAATARRDRDSREAGAHTPQERQAMVSQPLHKKGAREDRWFGQDPD
ncbi:hypothetical protein ACWDBW_30165 [Streptomyces sp. NPDC001107]